MEGSKELPLDVSKGHTALAISQMVDTPQGYREEEFNWRHDDSVVLEEQPATAIYLNSLDGLVIRQEASWCDDRDHVVIIGKDNIARFVAEVCERIGIPFAGATR